MSAQVKVYGQICIDPRYRDAFERFIQKKFNLKPTEYDLKTDAGASREIALKTPAGEWLVQNAVIAYEKHGVRTFVFCNHADCAYYGGSGSFSGFEEESRIYSDDLKKAAAVFKERLADINVLAYIAHKEQRQQEAFIFQQVVV